jgi:Protein of unknown function (DUF4031)
VTVYVDNMQLQASVGPVTGTDIEELHQLAESIGLRRSWFQDHPRHPHYDVTDGKRWQAIRAGAQEVDVYDAARMFLEPQPEPQPGPWPPTETGPCVSCGEPHRRYGPEGGPLCPSCRPSAGPSPVPSPEALRTRTRIAPRAAESGPDQIELFA